MCRTVTTLCSVCHRVQSERMIHCENFDCFMVERTVYLPRCDDCHQRLLAAEARQAIRSQPSVPWTALPIRDPLYAKTKEEDPNCPICLQSLFPVTTNGEQAQEEHDPVKVRCGHVFGKSCIAMWWREKRTCPMCRAPLN